MSIFDIIILILLSLEAINGYRHGFIEMIFFIASIFIALYVAKSFSGFIIEWINLTSIFAEHLAYIITFISTIVIVIIAAKFAGVIVQGAGFGVMNKIGGVLMGVVRSVLVLGFLFIVFEGINQRERFVNRNTLDNTFFYNPILTTGEFMLPYLSIDGVKEILDEFSIPKKSIDDKEIEDDDK